MQTTRLKNTLALFCEAFPDVDFGSLLTQTPESSFSITFDQTKTSYVETPVSHYDMNARGLHALAVALAYYEDHFPGNEEDKPIPTCLTATFDVNKKSPTNFVVNKFNVSNVFTYKKRVLQGADLLKRHWSAGGYRHFNDILSRWSYWLDDALFLTNKSQFDVSTTVEVIGNFLGDIETERSGEGFLLDESEDFDIENFDDFGSDVFDSSSSQGISVKEDQDSKFIDAELIDYLPTEEDDDDDWFLALTKKRNKSEVQLENRTPIQFDKAIHQANPLIDELVEQLVLLSIAQSLHQGKSFNRGLLESLRKIGGDKLCQIESSMFWAAVLGSSNLLRGVADSLNVPLHLLRLPERTVELRNVISRSGKYKKTFEFEGSEGSIYRHLPVLKPYLRFDEETRRLVDNLLLRKDDGDHEINFQLLASHIKKFQKDISAQKAFSNAAVFKRRLFQSVIGQIDAVEAMSNLYRKFVHPFTPDSPIAGMITFIGTSQSGKSLLASQLTTLLNELEPGLNYQSEVIPMENYADKNNLLKAIGSGSQYVNSALGDWTCAAEINPRTVFIFENIEKAHNQVQDALLSILENGEIRDLTSNRLVSFKQCIFIFTSSAGKEHISRRSA